MINSVCYFSENNNLITFLNIHVLIYINSFDTKLPKIENCYSATKKL